ncbi:unnamed protein product [Phytophthora fragariaefolia]|uniref:Unnamed protein product n=1 Tax=Phytophthora fragariaefolia TaxID=1490495 RepID=A0A9W6WV14_9STRA|nr:unnamed protein product [Phytophthora fragariaefolia]
MLRCVHRITIRFTPAYNVSRSSSVERATLHDTACLTLTQSGALFEERCGNREVAWPPGLQALHCTSRARMAMNHDGRSASTPVPARNRLSRKTQFAVCDANPPRRRMVRSRRAEHPTVNLELQQLDRYHDQAEQALSKTIAAYGKLDGPSVDTTQWKTLRARHGVRLFRSRQLTPEGLTPLLCVGTLRGRFDDVLEGLYCDNTEDMLLMNAIKCPRLAESVVLYAVQKKTTLEPFAFTGIKRVTIKLPVARNRDLCYFDKMGMVRQKSGKRMAYHVMHSVTLSECLKKAKHKRVGISLSYVFEELEDDLVGIYMQGEMSFATMPYFAMQAMSEVLLAVTESLECTRAKKLAHMMSVNRPGAQRRNSARKSCCYACKGSSSFFESMSNCAGCSEYVCKRCRRKKQVVALDTASGSRLKRADFCSMCIAKMDESSLAPICPEDDRNSVADVANAASEVLSGKASLPGSDRSLTSFVRNIAAQVEQQLSLNYDARASNLSFMGQLSLSDDESIEILEDESEDEDELCSSRLKTGRFVDNMADPGRGRCSTISTSSSSIDEDAEAYLVSLMAKLQQVSQQAEETLSFAREQSIVAHSVRDRSRRPESSGYSTQ